MAKCVKCGTKVGMFEKACAACAPLIEAERIEAEKAQAAAEAAANAQKEKDFFEKVKAGLPVIFDKFENKTQINTGYYKLGINSIDFASVNNETYWMIASHTIQKWNWLEDNRTIFLFADGTRFVSEHQPLRKSETRTAGYEVFCYEELHVDISQSMSAFEQAYLNNEQPPELRIGNVQGQFTRDMLRALAALYQVSEARKKSS